MYICNKHNALLLSILVLLNKAALVHRPLRIISELNIDCSCVSGVLLFM